MPEILVHHEAERERTGNIEKLSFGGADYMPDNTALEQPELGPEDDIDFEAEDPADYEDEPHSDDESGDDPEASRRKTVIPIWMLCGDQILWSAQYYRPSSKLPPREYLRRRLQLLLGFLSREFPGRKPEELLLSLRGFFTQDDEGGAWMDTLKTVGIVCGGQILPLGKFRAGRGKGKQAEGNSIPLPEHLEYLWLSRELEHHPEANPLDWKNCKRWLPEGLREFCRAVNTFCAKNFGREDDAEDGGRRKSRGRGLGIKPVNFSYNDDPTVMQRKRLGGWKKWLERQREDSHE